MTTGPTRVFCWLPLWNPRHAEVGLEHLVLGDAGADSVMLAIDEERGPFRLAYRLRWDPRWTIREVDADVTVGGETRALRLRTDGHGRWKDGDGRPLDALDGCLDVDIWPTPFTNTFPIHRAPLSVGERRTYRVAWVAAPAMTVRAVSQAYTRLAQRRYLFESLDDTRFQVELGVDDEEIVIDYPGLFRRVSWEP